MASIMLLSQSVNAVQASQETSSFCATEQWVIIVPDVKDLHMYTF